MCFWIIWDSSSLHHFFPVLRPAFSFDLLKCSRTVYNVLVQIITGHNYMARQQHIIDVNNEIDDPRDPICTLCHDGEQTSQHILGECGALNEIRFKYFGSYQLQPPFDSLKKGALVGFLREAPIDEVQFFFEIEHN